MATEGAFAIMHVSSAKSVGVVLMELLGSLMYNRNNNGLNTEPCGTPYLMGSVDELMP